METQLVIALTSALTATVTVFLSNFMAPRINAWFEQRSRKRTIYNKTLRTLLQIEKYIFRNLKNPSAVTVGETIVPQLKEMGIINEQIEAVLMEQVPSIIQRIQPEVGKFLPETSEAFNAQLSSVLDELSTVDPVLAFELSEKHIITPIQQMDQILISVFKNLGFAIPDNDPNLPLLHAVVSRQQEQRADELLAEIRSAILLVAERSVRKTRSDLQNLFESRDREAREFATKMGSQIADVVAQQNVRTEGSPKQDG